jgi:hypothetical protein
MLSTVYGNIYIDECNVLGASYLRETSSFRIFSREFYVVATVRLVALQWPRAIVPVGVDDPIQHRFGTSGIYQLTCPDLERNYSTYT